MSGISWRWKACLHASSQTCWSLLQFLECFAAFTAVRKRKLSTTICEAETGVINERDVDVSWCKQQKNMFKKYGNKMLIILENRTLQIFSSLVNSGLNKIFYTYVNKVRNFMLRNKVRHFKSFRKFLITQSTCVSVQLRGGVNKLT